jgi:hypothetical protein
LKNSLVIVVVLPPPPTLNGLFIRSHLHGTLGYLNNNEGGEKG